MDKKNRITLIVLAILSLLVATIGATFSYFSAVSRSKPQIITTSSLSFHLQIEGTTHVTNIKPTAWSNTLSDNETNTDIAKIPFKVTTKSGVKGNYDVIMSTAIPSNDKLTGGNASDIKYKLYKDETKIKEGSFSENFSEELITDSEILPNVTSNDKYKLYVYIEDNNDEQNSLQNISFIIDLNGKATQTE